MAYQDRHWEFFEPYQTASPEEQEMYQALDKIMFRVQYAKMGFKSQARREACQEVLGTIVDGVLYVHDKYEITMKERK